MRAIPFGLLAWWVENKFNRSNEFKTLTYMAIDNFRSAVISFAVVNMPLLSVLIEALLVNFPDVIF